MFHLVYLFDFVMWKNMTVYQSITCKNSSFCTDIQGDDVLNLIFLNLGHHLFSTIYHFSGNLKKNQICLGNTFLRRVLDDQKLHVFRYKIAILLNVYICSLKVQTKSYSLNSTLMACNEWIKHTKTHFELSLHSDRF